MKTPRSSISGLMAVVLIVGLALSIVRGLTKRLPFPVALIEILLIGVLTMASILAFGLAILANGRREPGPNRPALIGFEAFGLTAWLALLVCSILAPRPIHEWTSELFDAAGMTPGLAKASTAGVFFLIPQLGLAALGWWFGGRYVVRFSVTRRAPEISGIEPDVVGETASKCPGATLPTDFVGTA